MHAGFTKQMPFGYPFSHNHGSGQLHSMKGQLILKGAIFHFQEIPGLLFLQINFPLNRRCPSPMVCNQVCYSLEIGHVLTFLKCHSGCMYLQFLITSQPLFIQKPTSNRGCHQFLETKCSPFYESSSDFLDCFSREATQIGGKNVCTGNLRLTLPETNSSPLKMGDPLKRRFLLETTIFRGYLASRYQPKKLS